MTATVAGEADSRSGSFHDLVANWEDGADSGMLVNKNTVDGVIKTYPSCFPGPGTVYDSGIKFEGDSTFLLLCCFSLEPSICLI